MENEAKFNETVGILVKAYLNDELMHNNCSACAVGNIVKAHQGFVRGVDYGWAMLFVTLDNKYSQKKQTNHPSNYEIPSIKDEIDSTGYDWMDLAKIEYAFENVPRDKSNDEYIFNGLMAVVDVLAEIHGINLEVKESAKLLFVK